LHGVWEQLVQEYVKAEVAVIRVHVIWKLSMGGGRGHGTS